MESQPHNPEFGNNPETFHLCDYSMKTFVVVYVQIDKKCECKIVTFYYLLV